MEMNKKLIQAFTLIEVLAVIAIVGILSGLTIVSFGGVTQKAVLIRSLAFSDSLRDSLLMSIVLQLKFDEGTGQTAKDTWGTNDFTLGNDVTVEAVDPTWVSDDCVSGSCLNFSKNSGQFLKGSANLQLDFRSGVTLETFIKPASITENGAAIFCAGSGSPSYNEFALYFRSDGGLDYFLADGSVYAYNDYMADLGLIGSWHHLVYTYNYTTNSVIAYLDANVLPPTDAYYSTTKEQLLNYPITIGSYVTKDGNFFDGKIDTTRFYKSVLSLSKVRENYYFGLNKLLASSGISAREYFEKIIELTRHLTEDR